ncbi:MAG: hypothetical protein V4660_18625 [Pseudomonadota bacterium]
MKSSYICIILLAASISAAAVQEKDTAISADINCDGKTDVAKLEYINKEVKITLTEGDSGKSSYLIFGLEHKEGQESFCGKNIELSKFETIPNNSPEFIQGLGAVPEGHESKKGCFEISLSDGMCDSIHVYWNHKTNKLSYWRL